jgi:cell volume regulation protein A
MDAVTVMVLMIATLLILGALGEFIFTRTGIPDMIWLVVAGIAAGPAFHIIEPEMFEPIIPFFGAVALIAILAGEGVNLRISEVSEAAPRAFPKPQF